ncbi:MAG TPA: anion permease [Anaerolineaceae bacterium]|nr:anion permease [Anaerolineaceae bacterium]
MTASLVILVALASIYGFMNGFHDSSNIVATMISSRAMAPRQALTLTAVAEFIGPFISGVAVARTIGSDLVSSEAINPAVIIAALLAAILWSLLTWYLGIPSSSSHALFGGILGAAIVQAGTGVVHLAGLEKILVALLISPVLGLLVGYFLMKLVFLLVQNATPRINRFFKRGQVLTAIALGLTHGGNDAQKTMGVIILGLVTGGALGSFQTPIWVVALSAGSMAVGTLLGGWRLIHTLGMRLMKIRPVHAFTSQTASALVIFTALLLGGPVSVTHVISSAIMGVGSAERISKVRWPVVGEIAWAWILTIPAAGLLAAGLSLVIQLVFRASGAAGR